MKMQLQRSSACSQQHVGPADVSAFQRKAYLYVGDATC